MARGWESKAVADQIEAADVRPQDVLERPSDLSPEMLARYERVESLKLSRVRILDQLEGATNTTYRETLLRALAAIEIEIEELSAD
jgi:hypothetical protein